ncbi:alpha-tocopherol transfer protein [Drosophila busckii]|nr:alpha-tocopherol transfer protein [Drosophila busckii]
MPNIRALNPELQAIALKELNEVPERIDQDIAALRLWIEQQPHLKARTNDQFLVNFLRGCKYSLEKTKSKLDRFYTLRTKFPSYFLAHNVDVDELLKLFSFGTFIVLPRPLNDNGPRIILLRMAAYDPDKYQFADINRAAGLMFQIMLDEDDYTTVNGTMTIVDLDNVKAGHFLQMTPTTTKKLVVFQEEALPVRTKATHFINLPTGFDTIFNMFKPMMSKKQQGRLHVHGSNLKSLYKHIPQEYLPVEYGGANGSIAEIVKDWEKRIDAYRDYWVEEQQYGTDESLRAGKPVDFESLFGLEGSFRQLNVD